MTPQGAFTEGRTTRRAVGARVSSLFDEHASMVFGLCRLLLRDHHEAEDASQQTFVSAYRALLRGTDRSVAEVCFAVGCSSLGTFSTRFTELVGMPPREYRRQAAGETAGMPPCVAKQVTRPVRNREASATAPR